MRKLKSIFHAILSIFGTLSLLLSHPNPAGASLRPDSAEILFIGDSHALMPSQSGAPGGYAAMLELFLKSQGYRTRFLAATGSSPVHWLEARPSQAGYMELSHLSRKTDIEWQFVAKARKTPYLETPSGKEKETEMTFENLLKMHNPKGVIVAQGSNLVGALKPLIRKIGGRRLQDLTEGQQRQLLSMPAFQDVRQIAALATQSATSCLWIGPPMMNLFRPLIPILSDLIAESLKGSKCRYIAAHLATNFHPATAREIQSDGVHFSTDWGRKISRKWGHVILTSEAHREFIFDVGPSETPSVVLPWELQTPQQQAKHPRAYQRGW